MQAMQVKISWQQLAAMLIMSRLFSECLNFPNDITRYEMQEFTIVLAAKLIIFLFFIPTMILNSKLRKAGRQGNFFSLIAKKNKFVGWLIFLALAWTLLYFALATTAKLEFYAANTIMKEASPEVLIILAFAALIYCVCKGLQPIARLGSLVLAVFIIFFLIAAVVLANKIDINFLYPDFFENAKSFREGITGEIGKNAEIFIYAILANYVAEPKPKPGKEKPGICAPNKTAIVYLPVLLFITESLTFIKIVVFGPYLDKISFPNYRISSLLNIIIFERMDGLDVVIWTVSAILKTVMLIICVETMLYSLVSYKASKITVIALTAAAGILTWFSAKHHHFLITAYRFGWELVALITFMITLPVISIFLVKGKKKNEMDDAKKVNA